MSLLAQRFALAALAVVILLCGAPMAQAETFQAPHFGYRLEIPPGWEKGSTTRPYSALFTPAAGPTTGLASVMVINLPRPTGSEPNQAAIQAAASYAQEVSSKAKEGAIQRQAPFRWDMGDAVVMGAQVVARFTVDGIPMQQWAVFLPQPKAEVIHLWQFTASAGDFETYLPAAQAILDSLKPVTE
jgi:hypothetical protein